MQGPLPVCAQVWQTQHPSKEHLEMLDTTSSTLPSTGDLLSQAHTAFLPPQAGFLSLVEIPGRAGQVKQYLCCRQCVSSPVLKH